MLQFNILYFIELFLVLSFDFNNKLSIVRVMQVSHKSVMTKIFIYNEI